MIHKIFGVIDIFVAALLYFGDVPGPSFLVNAIIFLLLAKGAVSLVYMPFLFIPGIVMSLTDVFAVLLLYFAAVPLASIKGILMVIILIKALPALLMDIAKILG
ncbi:MAG: hypothetical protein ABIG84_03445 [archaeon]